MWVTFVVLSRPYCEGFSSGFSCLLPSLNSDISQILPDLSLTLSVSLPPANTKTLGVLLNGEFHGLALA